MPHDITLGPARPGTAIFPVTMNASRDAGPHTPVTAPARASALAPARIPAYRWRMMVALAAVIASGFLLGMLMTAPH